MTENKNQVGGKLTRSASWDMAGALGSEQDSQVAGAGVALEPRLPSALGWVAPRHGQVGKRGARQLAQSAEKQPVPPLNTEAP